MEHCGRNVWHGGIWGARKCEIGARAGHGCWICDRWAMMALNRLKISPYRLFGKYMDLVEEDALDRLNRSWNHTLDACQTLLDAVGAGHARVVAHILDRIPTVLENGSRLTDAVYIQALTRSKLAVADVLWRHGLDPSSPALYAMLVQGPDPSDALSWYVRHVHTLIFYSPPEGVIQRVRESPGALRRIFDTATLDQLSSASWDIYYNHVLVARWTSGTWSSAWEQCMRRPHVMEAALKARLPPTLMRYIWARI